MIAINDQNQQIYDVHPIMARNSNKLKPTYYSKLNLFGKIIVQKFWHQTVVGGCFWLLLLFITL